MLWRGLSVRRRPVERLCIQITRRAWSAHPYRASHAGEQNLEQDQDVGENATETNTAGNQVRTAAVESGKPVSRSVLMSAHGASTVNQSITIRGLVRSIRKQRRVAFAQINDGSSLESIQAVFSDPELAKR
jgi:hypothetical protein